MEDITPALFRPFFVIIVGILFLSGCTMRHPRPFFSHPEPPKITSDHYRIFTGTVKSLL